MHAKLHTLDAPTHLNSVNAPALANGPQPTTLPRETDRLERTQQCAIRRGRDRFAARVAASGPRLARADINAVSPGRSAPNLLARPVCSKPSRPYWRLERTLRKGREITGANRGK